MKTKLFINNAWIDSSDQQTFERKHPVSSEVMTESANATVTDAIKAAQAAEEAFKTWKDVGPSERRRLLLKVADVMESKTPKFIEVMAMEVGASALWAGFNVHASANVFREAASLATQIQGETIPTDKAETLSMTLRQPVGPILSIVPWNGTAVLAARAIAYPLVCGNTVVFKGSEFSPATHALITQCVQEAGLPAGVLNYLNSSPDRSPEIADALISAKEIRRINFTGSTRVGSIIAQKAAQHLKRCLLELGGKSPLIVLDDADINAAVKAAVFGSFLFQGQICMSTERLVLMRRSPTNLSLGLSKKTERLSVGDPCLTGDCIIGPMVSPNSGERINGLFKDAIDKGAKVVCGGMAQGAVMPATILDHVKSDMRIYDEETFGPITVVIRCKGEAEAIRIANDSVYGLSSGVFGRDINRALRVGMSIEYGCVHINGSTVQNEAQAPYGGTKNTGYGRFDGRAVIDEFTELKWLTIEPFEQQYPF